MEGAFPSLDLDIDGTATMTITNPPLPPNLRQQLHERGFIARDGGAADRACQELVARHMESRRLDRERVASLIAGDPE